MAQIEARRKLKLVFEIGRQTGCSVNRRNSLPLLLDNVIIIAPRSVTRQMQTEHSDPCSLSMMPKFICIIILNWTIVNAAANSFSFSEKKIWNLLSGPSFTPRHSHATCVFKCPDNTPDVCIWLTGGYSKEHRTFNLVMEHENSDVWWSKDGANWTQVTKLLGDFLPGIGNGDAKVGGYVAPWYSRYGHTLNAIDTDNDGHADIMILAGGFSPLPSNDAWLTTDGITWHFEGYAPWPKRA